jgi:L-cysteine desulfidase
LLGGTREQIEGAMKSLIASLTGTLCDGAKESCSFKLETAAGEAAVYAFLALEDVYIKDEQGVVENSLENSIKNMQLVSEYGMQNADDAILKIITNRM